jgi:hypothetical protein
MSRNLLMQSLLGHMALLAEKYPEKAATPVAKAARRAVKLSLQVGDRLERTQAQAPVQTQTLRKAA